MIRRTKVIIITLGLCFSSSVFSEIHWQLDRAIRLFMDFEIVVHAEVEIATVIFEDAENTLFKVTVRTLESFRGDAGDRFCYVTQYQKPVHGKPSAGSTLIFGANVMVPGRDCYEQEPGAVIPDKPKFVNLMRSLRDANK